MKQFLNWILYSSVNPTELSMTARGFIIGIIPTILTVSKISCGLHLACFELDENTITGFAQAVGNIVLGLLTLVGGVQFVYGFVRKVILTIHK